jgi:hypothetical protein
MTVSSTTSKASYSGNGTTTAFTVPFYFLEAADVQVILRSSAGVETVQALTTNYTVAGAGVTSGGTVTMLVAPAAGTTLTILRNIEATQETDLVPNDRLPAETLEVALDKATMLIQQLDEEAGRSLKYPASDNIASAQFPASSARANKFLSFDANGLLAMTVGVDSSLDVFIQDGSGATPRSVTSKLRDVVSVKDFGAIGDGVADDTSAIQAAINVAKSVSGGGVVYLPKGKYKTTAPLNLTGLFFSQNLIIRGDGRWASQIVVAFNGANALDLSGSVLVTLSDFGIVPSGSFKVDQVILCARPVTNNSSGNHIFQNLYVEGNCNNAVVVLWGSEENQFVNCWITCGNGGSARDFPALVIAVKISECGFTPTSTFITLGTGSGGVGMQTFVGCRIANESGFVQTNPLMRLYGTLGAAFYNCFFTCWPGASGNTIDINGSTYPDDANSLYPAVVTFDTCSDENGFGDQTTQRTISFGATPVAGLANIRGAAIRNCQFSQVYGQDGSIVDGFHYVGGKFSNSVPSPTGAKMSFYNLFNSCVAVSKSERALTYTVRNIGEANLWRGINAGNVAIGVDTTSVIMDASGGILASAGVLSRGATGVIGYAAGAGGAITQTGSAADSVTLNKPVGKVTTVSLTTAANGLEEFSFVNSLVTINDALVVSSTYAGNGSPNVYVKSVQNGECTLCIRNQSSVAALNAAVTINFAIIRGIES